MRKFPGAFTQTGGRPEALGYVQRAFRRQFQGGIFGIGEAIRSGDFNEAKKMLNAAVSSNSITKSEADALREQLGMPKTPGGTVETEDQRGKKQMQKEGMTERPTTTNVTARGAQASAFTVNRAVGGAIYSQTQVVLTLDGKTIAEVIAKHF